MWQQQGESLTRPYKYALILGVLWIALFIGFLSWYRTVYDVTGRLILPAHISLAIAITAGLAALSARVPRAGIFLRTVSVGVFVLTGGIFTFVSLHAAYVPQIITRAEVPPLQGTVFDFDDTVRLLGYAHDGDTFTDNDQITLCWEVLQPTERFAAYAVRYVKDGIPVANRTTVHGLGKYNSTLWQTGDIFCDGVDMSVGNPLFGGTPPESGTTYDILVVMLDANTQAVDWQAITLDGTPVQFPVLGQLSYR
jgi:hypothetical protein